MVEFRGPTADSEDQRQVDRYVTGDGEGAFVVGGNRFRVTNAL
jgi:hypothetical protein